MKKILFLVFLVFIPLIGFALNDTVVLSKTSACKLKDGYYNKGLSVKYPGYDPSTYEFIKKEGKLVYFVHLISGDSIRKVLAYEYSCKTKKTKEIGIALQNSPYGGLSLEGASSEWIIGAYTWGDGPGPGAHMDMVLMNRRTGEKKIMDFSQFSGFSSIIKNNSVNKKALDIGVFKSTNNPNVFYATLALFESDEYGNYWGGGNSNWMRVIVDVSKKTILPSGSANTNVTQNTIGENYSIGENYRFYNGKVQYKEYSNLKWYDTALDKNSIVLSSPYNGKDVNGSFYAGTYLKVNGKNVLFDPIGATSKISSRYFQDGKTDFVYVMNEGGNGALGILSGAKASDLYVLDYLNYVEYDRNMTIKRESCKETSDPQLLSNISAFDNNFCYGTYGSAPGNQIKKVTERIR